VAFQRDFVVLGTITPEGSGVSDEKALTSRQYSWKLRVWKPGAL